MSRLAFSRLLLVVLLHLTAIPLISQTTFTGVNSWFWGDAGNWDNGLPAPGNDATIPADKEVHFNADITIDFTVTNYGIFWPNVFLTIDSSGFFHNKFSGMFIQLGTLNNYGVIQNEGSSEFGFVNSSTFNNYGTFDNMGIGYFKIEAPFNNLGLFNNRGDIVNSNSFYNYGTIENNLDFNSPGTILIKSFATFQNSGIVNNNIIGTIENLGTLTNDSTVNNIGTFLNTGIFHNNQDIHNMGEFQNEGNMYNYGTGYIENENIYRCFGVTDNSGIIYTVNATFQCYGTLINPGIIYACNSINDVYILQPGSNPLELVICPPEICDGLDNDSDGLIDEGFPDTDGDGIADCMDPEVCDGVDNDGDGLVDEYVGSPFTLVVSTDCWANELSWDIGYEFFEFILDSVAAGTEYVSGQTYYHTICLWDDCYVFNIYDSYGDGMAPQAGCVYVGDYYMLDPEGNVIFQMTPSGDYGYGTTHSFCVDHGCMDAQACNYLPWASLDDGSCSYPGCMDVTACNYDPSVLCPDYLMCEYTPCNGCTDPLACNYDESKSFNDGSCTYPGCMDVSACNFDPAAACVDESCEYQTCRGCTGLMACNYDSTASIDDGTCEYVSCAGCTYPGAENFDAAKTLDDGSCTFAPSEGCAGDFNGDLVINTTDLLGFLSVYGSTCP